MGYSCVGDHVCGVLARLLLVATPGTLQGRHVLLCKVVYKLLLAEVNLDSVQALRGSGRAC